MRIPTRSSLRDCIVLKDERPLTRWEICEEASKTIAFNKLIPISEVRNYGFTPNDKFFLKDDDLIGKLTGSIPVFKSPKIDLDKVLQNLH